jgi:hypothetical protein
MKQFFHATYQMSVVIPLLSRLLLNKPRGQQEVQTAAVHNCTFCYLLDDHSNN